MAALASHPYMLVDAFSDQPLAGNACAVVFEADDLDETAMLAVAREFNLAETAFVGRARQADFAARYFTPAEEIPLAGHPTLATAYALVASGRLAIYADRQAFSLELLHGPVTVELLSRAGTLQQIVMTQRRPRFLQTYDPAEVLPLFNLPPEAALAGLPVQTVSTGTPQLMVPVRGLDDLRQARMDIPAYDAFQARSDFFSPHLFCLQGVTPSGQTFARHFGSPPDLLEDPFTGSATGAMAAYLWRYGLMESPVFTAEQGHWLGRPGQATVEVLGPPQDIETVKVGGAAVLVGRGELYLPGPGAG